MRVDSERLDQLMHLMGELVVHRTHAESLVAHAGIPGLQQAMQDLARSSQALQAMVMQVRMIPVEAVFLRLPRLVRDLSSRFGKKVELVLAGSDLANGWAGFIDGALASGLPAGAPAPTPA